MISRVELPALIQKAVMHGQLADNAITYARTAGAVRGRRIRQARRWILLPVMGHAFQNYTAFEGQQEQRFADRIAGVSEPKFAS